MPYQFRIKTSRQKTNRPGNHYLTRKSLEHGTAFSYSPCVCMCVCRPAVGSRPRHRSTSFPGQGVKDLSEIIMYCGVRSIADSRLATFRPGKTRCHRDTTCLLEEPLSCFIRSATYCNTVCLRRQARVNFRRENFTRVSALQHV